MNCIRYKRIQLVSTEPVPPPPKVLRLSRYSKLLNDKVTYLQVKKRDCTWSGVDDTDEHPVMTKYMAKFSSEEAATEFKHTFEEVCI